ncbi:DUF998 domain-containing protein [Aquimarina sp. 2201CG5-10]|uniref:DUF998 domain-containing protein n=1 Tax=Aquimarina callyspongiae TaxID=3098150 RepID=UPI002AB42F0A|nr:DUF998 domain-containing protein [Aquimarina sp. 2201CG5-10]MDY8136126.1 DUF998 domain-containing protein [Aquimarina sp. 2201CG5-10]
MRNNLLKQIIYLPILYFGTIILASFFAEGYSNIEQHASELAINKNQTAGDIFNIGIFLTGISLVLYGIGLRLNHKAQFSITSILIIIFGITFLFGVIYKIGSPWHGLYGIGISIIMLPLAFLYELKRENINRFTKNISILSTILIFFYLWAMIAGLDPAEYRGLTQRIFGGFTFGFISYTAYITSRLKAIK